jgi:hypothetical protein
VDDVETRSDVEVVESQQTPESDAQGDRVSSGPKIQDHKFLIQAAKLLGTMILLRGQSAGTSITSVVKHMSPQVASQLTPKTTATPWKLVGLQVATQLNHVYLRSISAPVAESRFVYTFVFIHQRCGVVTYQ